MPEISHDYGMAATAQELLDAVNDAILAILSGGAVKSYGIGGSSGRTLERMSLDELRTLRAELMEQVAASNSSTGRTSYVTFGRIE